MSLAPQSLLVVGKAPVTSPTPENIFDRLLTLLRESSGASSVYNEVMPSMSRWMELHRIRTLMIVQQFEESTFEPGARFHGRGLSAKVEPDA